MQLFRSICVYIFGIVYATGLFGQGKGLLWKIEDPKSKHVNYVFGTIHLISASKFSIPKPLAQVLEQAETLVFELDVNAMSSATDALQNAFLPEFKSLEDFTSAENYQKIQAFYRDTLKHSEEEWQFLKRMKPIFLSQQLMNANQSEDMKSYELEIVSQFANSGEKVEGLETISEQLAMFDQIAIADQIQMVLSTIESKQKAQTEFENLEKVYLSRDLSAIDAFMQSNMKAESNMYSALLVQRNQAWIPKIEAYCKQNQVVMSVGAAHLAGKQGIIQLLREKGYILTPIW